MVRKKREFPHLFLRVAYRGDGFSGFQWQKDKPTVQSKLESSMAQLFPERNDHLTFTSRTDAGVHAYDQIVFLRNATQDWQKKTTRQQNQFLPSLNYFLGPAISVWQMGWLREDFNPAEHILFKTYEYKILNSPHPDPMKRYDYWWIRAPLHLKKMESRLQQLMGEHDFAAFAKASGKEAKKKKRGTTRTLMQARLNVSSHECFPEASLLHLRFRANGFLQHMIRNIVGTLVDEAVGKNIDTLAALKARKRENAGKTAASHGLCLIQTKLDSRRLRLC